MSEETAHTPQTVAGELDVSPATLRRWSQRFEDFLSAEATGSSESGRTHRRYTDDDLTTLRIIKELMNNGMTYEQVHQHLSAQFVDPTGAELPTEFPPDVMAEAVEEKGLVVSEGNEPAAVAFLTNALTTLSESQQSILNSQAANRELMGVLIQDNFNLKEENNRLRERILDVERNLAQARQQEDWQREAVRQELDAKIASVQQLANDAIKTAHEMPAPNIKAVKSKPGCLGALLGLSGDVQIVSVPKGRQQRADGRPASAPLSPSWSPHPFPQQQPQESLARSHPKPSAPPE